MAGTDPGFNSAEFRDAIHLAMSLGAAPDPSDQVMFHFETQVTYNVPADGANVPFYPGATATRVAATPLHVDCAVEYFDAENQPTRFGLLAPSRLAITLLDIDYQRVKDAKYVVCQGDRYDYRRTEPPAGLFDVGLFVMHFTSQSET